MNCPPIPKEREVGRDIYLFHKRGNLERGEGGKFTWILKKKEVLASLGSLPYMEFSLYKFLRNLNLKNK